MTRSIAIASTICGLLLVAGCASRPAETPAASSGTVRCEPGTPGCNPAPRAATGSNPVDTGGNGGGGGGY